MSMPYATPTIITEFSQAPVIGAVLIALLASGGWVLSDPVFSQSIEGGIFGSSQSWMTMAIVFAISAVVGFFGVKWWVENF